MAQITVTQSAEDTSGAPSLTGVTSGRVLVAVIGARAFFGNTPDVSSVSGGTDTTWSEATAHEQADGGCWIWVGTGNTASSVTLSVSGTSLDALGAVLYELSADADAVDVTSANGSGGTATASFDSGTTAALASDESLAIGGDTQSNSKFVTHSWDTPWVEDHDSGMADGDAAYTSAHIEVTSTSGVAATGTFSDGNDHDWAAVVAVIKPAGGGAQALAIGRVTETENARTLTWTRLVAIGRIVETEAARPISAARTVPVGRASESEAARALSSAKAATVGRVAEAEAARALKWTRTAAIGRVTEGETAQAVTGSHSAAIARVVEGEAARSFTWSRTLTIGRVTETETARALSTDTRQAIGRVVEAETAQALSATKTIAIGRATETETGRVLAWSRTATLTRVTEGEVARQLPTPGANPATIEGSASVTSIAGNASPTSSIAGNASTTSISGNASET